MIVQHPEDGRRWGVLVPWTVYEGDADGRRPTIFERHEDYDENRVVWPSVQRVLSAMEFDVRRPIEVVRVTDGCAFFYLPEAPHA